ncbi:disease resistance protein RPP13-like [Carex rostrata]
MTEVVVEFVLKKLADIIAKEARLLGGVGKKVERVQRELTRIKCCLQDADSKRKGDARVQNWLNELRDVAYRIEDATDTFLLKVGYRDASFLQKLKKLCNKSKELYFRHNLANELDEIQNVLEEISKSKVAYGISDLQDNNKGEDDVIMPLRRATYQEVDKTEVVGMQADKNNILKLLHPDQTPRRAVITIVGTGGLGKTTLAHMVYKSARANFDYHVMLSISQKFSLKDLLRKMLQHFDDSVWENQAVGDLITELKSFLINKRYLIILDDVWKDDLWYQLRDALPDDKNGSRVLITSRSIEVATSADSQMVPYKLNLLDDRKSLDLLLKKALPYQEIGEKCPIDLLEVANKLLKKCNGLPLALVVLGGILSTKEPSYPAWERVLQAMNWYSDNKDIMRILSMSYEDMPYYLKACFQYLAFFPEDYVISAKRLIRMWISEGFIPIEGRPTMEIMAEDCLEKLSKRSMVQVLSRSANGLIKQFKVHDILRDLAVHEAEHENFVVVFSQASDDKQPNRIIRRASLQAQEKNSRFIKYVGPNTRSLLLFDAGYCEMSLHCSNFKLLKVLEIVGVEKFEYELKLLGELIHLKYLGLRGCDIDLSTFSFHRMKRLETLDVRGSKCNLPCDDLWTIGTLMHVLVDYRNFFDGPTSKDILMSNLQTLKWITVTRACNAKLPNIRKLGIRNECDEWVSITNLLQTLPVMVSLGIASDNCLPMEIVYPKTLPNYQNLQSLLLNGKWPENVNIEASLLPPHLVKLTLEWSLLNHNPMPELGKLNGLKKLYLGYHAFSTSHDWEGPIICPQGFPVLQYLKVGSNSSIKDLTVAQGVMPKLTYLQAHYQIKVQLPPELQHVTVEKW